MPLPKKITPCPIVDTSLELRFNSLMPSEAVFGIIYEKFNSIYGQVEKLPILQIPEEIRSKDQNLIYQPHYRLKSEMFIIGVGPKVISFGLPNDYVGWDAFYKEAKVVLSRVKKAKIFNKIERLGVRYINFFEDDIFEKIKLKIRLDEDNFYTEQTHYRAILKNDDFKQNLQIVNNASVNKNGKVLTGSIIDIDTSLERNDASISSGLNNFIESAHKKEKTLFFSLLKDDFLATLNPEL